MSNFNPLGGCKWGRKYIYKQVRLYAAPSFNLNSAWFPQESQGTCFEELHQSVNPKLNCQAKCICTSNSFVRKQETLLVLIIRRGFFFFFKYNPVPLSKNRRESVGLFEACQSWGQSLRRNPGMCQGGKCGNPKVSLTIPSFCTAR